MLAKGVTVTLLVLLIAAVAKRRLQDGMREEGPPFWTRRSDPGRVDVLSPTDPAGPGTESDVSGFLDRVFDSLPDRLFDKHLDFKAWRVSGRPTKEGVGVMSIRGIDVDKLAATIMNVSEYQGNIPYVQESRVIANPDHVPPESVHFYLRLKMPKLPALQSELVLSDFGERDGWRVLAWYLLHDETDRLSPREAARCDYNFGAWLLRPDAVAHAATSAPMRPDVAGWQYATFTSGADALATCRVNIQSMVALSRR